MNAHGTLLSADSIRIQSDSTAHNSGTIAGRRAVQIAALDIDNIGGRIVADTVSLQAQRDINVIGGSVSAALALLAQAGNDINVQTTTRSSSGGTGANGYANTVIDQVAALSVTGTSNATESTTLALQAGRDITLQAAQITNTATNGATQISAGHNLNLETVGTAREQRITWDSRNHLFFGSSQEVGTQIDTQGSTLLAAGNDITARATQVQSAADVRLQAGGDIHIATGQASQWLDDAYYIQSSGLLGSSSETWINKVHTTEAQASSIGAETIQISAGRNLEVTGSNVVSDKGTALQAGQDITIAAASNTHNALHFNEERRSGVFSNGGIGFTVGSQMQSTDQRGQQTSAAASTVGSIEGSVSIQAGQNYRQIGSDVLAPKGDIAIAAKDIAITEAEQTHNSEQHTRFKQSGISVSIGSPIISMAQTAQGMAQAASNTSDTRMQALAAGAAALNVSNNSEALQAIANGNPAAGASISISVGSSQSRSDSYQSASTSQGSHVQASGDVQITATGAAENSNLTIQGSDITAGNNANLTADNDITLLASTDTHSERSTNKSSSGSLGVSVGQGGIGITASASRGKGYANSDDTSYNNTRVTAGNTVTMESGNDTQLKGAVVSAEQVTANVGGNLNIQSLQDSSTFDGKQQNIGGSITVGAGFSASVSYSNSKASGSYASVTEQSGIQAGDNGFQIHVQGNTSLQGATIASTQEAIENDRNSLRTGTLTSSDIANRSNYKASGINLSGGFTVAGNNPADQSTGTSSTVDNGENWSWQNFNKTGTSGAAAGVSSDKGNTQSTTTSSISAGQFTMTDAEGQQQKTGQSAAQMVASIDRTAITGDSASGLEKTWNGQQLLQAQTANAQIIATFGQQASKAIGDYAAQKLQEAQAAQDQAGIDAWKEGGTARIALHALIGGLTGGVQGALGAGAASAAAPAIEQLQEQLQDALQNAGLGENTAKTLASLTGGATAATIGAAASGGTAAGAAAGAAGGFNADMNNRQLHPDEYELARRYAKLVADKLQISETEAEGRIVAEILRNSDEKTNLASNGIHDYEIRSLIGCQNLNCYGYKNDPEYKNHTFNGEHIFLNYPSYIYGTSQLGTGQTHDQLVISNIRKDPVGPKVAAAGMVGLGIATGGALASPKLLATGAVIGTGVNSSMQLYKGMPFDWWSFGIAGVTGAMTTGQGFTSVLSSNMGGSLTGSLVNGENPNAGMVGTAIGVGIGYPVGATVTSRMHTQLNPWYRPQWKDIGYGISAPVGKNPLPAWTGDVTSGYLQEYGSNSTKDKINSNERK